MGVDADLAAYWEEFRGIGQQIDQHLLEQATAAGEDAHHPGRLWRLGAWRKRSMPSRGKIL
jgi:hypothetical protein